MSTERGVVLRTEAQKAWVATQRSGACESCAAKGSCSSMGPGEEMEVEAVNASGARVGDTVVIEVKTSSVLKLSFFLYIFPILCLLLGAFAGHHMAPRLGLNQTAASALLGFLFLLAAFGVIKIREKPLSRKQEYKPRITRILKKRG